MTPTPEPTRQRILAAALALFAERGYRGTTVGEIEAAAGLTPRAGAFYRHFASKEAVLAAAFQERGEAVDELVGILDHFPLGDLRAELTLIGRVALDDLAEERTLLRVVMKEGDRVPALRDEFFERFVRRGYATAREYLKRTLATRGVELDDPDAVAAAIFGGLVHFHLVHTVFDRPPPDVDEDRFIAAWVDTTLAALAGLGAGEPAAAEEAAT
jgi:AcrR family transcriptional regulator